MSISRAWPLLATVVVLFVPTAMGQSAASQQDPAAGISEARKPCLVTQKQHRRYIRAVYRRENVSKRSLNRLQKMRRCAHSPKAARNMRQLQRSERRQRRARIRVERCTPYGKWAIPAYIVMRESRGIRTARNRSSTAGGYYQFIDSTWYAYGGSRYNDSHPAAVAPAVEQHCVAHRAWAGGSGSSHWALTR